MRTTPSPFARPLMVLLIFAIVSGCSDNDTAQQSNNRSDSQSGPARCSEQADHPWCDTSLSAQQRAELLVAAMSLEQKIDYLAGDDPAAAATGDPYVGVVNGFPELGIPPLRMSDGPVGVRGSPATALPVPLSLASTFNPALAYQTGALVGNEVRNKGNDLVHAPVSDLIRNPLAGRTFETFGEDPLLSTRLTVEWVKGAQDEGVMANVKHYVMNTQEGLIGLPPITAAVSGRHLVNVVIDERTLREIYLPPYEAAVSEADVASMMCAYNYVNGEPACASSFLLQQVLRDDWGFDGFLISDYLLAIKDTVQTLNTAPVIEMPVAMFYQQPLVQSAVQSGQVSEQTLDQNLHAIMRTLFRFGFFDRPAYVRDDAKIDQRAHARIARQTIEQGSVLLRNQGGLPISPDVRRIAVIGRSATERPTGGGSSLVTPFQFVTPLDAIIERAGEEIIVEYADGSDQAAAATLAAASDLAIVFASNVSTEGVDKFCLALDCTVADIPDSSTLNTVQAGAPDLLDMLADPALNQEPVASVLEQAFGPVLLGGQPIPVSHRNQDALIEAVAEQQANTVVVLQTAGPVLTPWRESVNAILEIWYGGQEAGTAVAGLLFGDSDPGGRLPVTFPMNETDTPVAGDPMRYPGVANQAEHSEGVFIGYRWFDQQSIEPAYAFGFGLSYTQFQITDFQLTSAFEAPLELEAQLHNTGARAGWAVPQLYAGLPSPGDNVPQPVAALKGFEKLWLEPGETRTLRFSLDQRALSYWDMDSASWQMAPGCYQLMLGQSARDLPLKVAVPLAGGVCP